jgi:hypothetical protein
MISWPTVESMTRELLKIPKCISKRGFSSSSSQHWKIKPLIRKVFI